MDTNGHTILSEDYVSFKVAKLLKEKGFNELCFRLIREDGEMVEMPSQTWNGMTKKQKAQFYLCPTHQRAMKWLREVHKLAAILSPQWAEGDMRNPCRWYWEIRGLENIDTDVYSNLTYYTYEQACEAAIKYCLEYLI